MVESVTTPSVKWAQTKDVIYLIVEASDVTENKVNLTPEGTLKFSGKAPEKQYELEIHLNGEVNVEKTKWKLTGRHVDFRIQKKESGPYWSRLTKENEKFKWITIDWNRWRDEDSDHEDAGMGGFDQDYDNLPENQEDSDDEEKGNLEDLDLQEEGNQAKPEEQEAPKEEKKEQKEQS